MTLSLRFVLVLLSIASLRATPAYAETVKCRGAISAASAAYLQARAKTLQKCREGIVKGTIVLGPSEGCATRPKVAAIITKACGGADKTLATGDDLTPTQIGFPVTCLNAAVPACAGSVGSLTQLESCVDCIARFKADCADAAAIPGLATPYPTKCNAGAKPPTFFTLNAVASGAYNEVGTHFAGNSAVGWYTNSDPGDLEARDYFVFDLSSITRTVLSAFRRLSTAPPGFLRYGSDDPSETFTLFAVASTPIATLTAGTGDGVSAFTDLGAGSSYGSRVVTPNPGATIDVSFNGTGVAYLQANSNGLVVMGGAVTTLAKGLTDDEFLFNSTNATLTRQLIVATIE